LIRSGISVFVEELTGWKPVCPDSRDGRLPSASWSNQLRHRRLNCVSQINLRRSAA